MSRWVERTLVNLATSFADKDVRCLSTALVAQERWTAPWFNWLLLTTHNTKYAQGFVKDFYFISFFEK